MERMICPTNGTSLRKHFTNTPGREEYVYGNQVNDPIYNWDQICGEYAESGSKFDPYHSSDSDYDYDDDSDSDSEMEIEDAEFDTEPGLDSAETGRHERSAEDMEDSTMWNETTTLFDDSDYANVTSDLI
ncbi:hypothetical protein TWF718_001050 [Orbilia javanica]|uniref:Uncharacterized protein n=1 Tax=Orbilia javanica TaxID=47235 RepID=A0AAN8MY23_9PEZI